MYVLETFFPGIAIIALALVVDARTGRGYALGILSFLLLAFTFLVDVTVTLVALQPQAATMRGFGKSLLFVFNFYPTMYFVVAIVAGAAIVAGVAGQWRWLVGLVIAGLILALTAVLPLPIWDVGLDVAIQPMGIAGIEFNPVGIALTFLPQATVLAFSIARIVRPVTYDSARQPAPSASR